MVVTRKFDRKQDSPQLETNTMKTWSKPEFQNLRYGFEINLYVKVR